MLTANATHPVIAAVVSHASAANAPMPQAVNATHPATVVAPAVSVANAQTLPMVNATHPATAAALPVLAANAQISAQNIYIWLCQIIAIG